MADLDQDDSLSVNEFRAFAIPELFPHMHFHMVQETILDLDWDSDGNLSVDEYLSAILQVSKEKKPVTVKLAQKVPITLICTERTQKKEKTTEV